MAKSKQEKKAYAHLAWNENAGEFFYQCNYSTLAEATENAEEEDIVFEVTAVFHMKKNIKVVKGDLSDV